MLCASLKAIQIYTERGFVHNQLINQSIDSLNKLQKRPFVCFWTIFLKQLLAVWIQVWTAAFISVVDY